MSRQLYTQISRSQLRDIVNQEIPAGVDCGKSLRELLDTGSKTERRYARQLHVASMIPTDKLVDLLHREDWSVIEVWQEGEQFAMSVKRSRYLMQALEQEQKLKAVKMWEDMVNRQWLRLLWSDMGDSEQ